jgi:hypothetical protein
MTVPTGRNFLADARAALSASSTTDNLEVRVLYVATAVTFIEAAVEEVRVLRLNADAAERECVRLAKLARERES